MQHVLRTLVIAAFAFSGMNACAPGAKAPVSQPSPPSGFAPSVDSSKLIYVTPVEGVSSAARLVLADAIAAALRDAKKPAVLADKVNDKGPTVSGHIVEVQERDTVYWVTAAWALMAPYGTPVAEYRHQIVVDKQLWQTGAPEAINLLIADAGPMIAGMVRDYVSPVALAEAPPAPAAAAAMPSAVQPPAATEKPKGASLPDKPASAAAPEALTATAPRDVAPTPDKPAAAASAKAPSVRPKVIPRRPATAPSALTAKPLEVPVETAALTPPPEAGKPKPAEKAKPAEPGRPMLLTKGAPPRQPKEKPVDDESARKAAKPVLMPVPGESASLVPDPPPVVWSRPSFLIRPVEGAPGDGNVSLTNAMKAALRKRDLTVTEDPRQAGFVIQGRVEVGPAVAGRQQAKIVWAVNTISGEEVGKAVQENAVKAGSLDGPWGRIAEIVSSAAVTGIQELFGVGEKQSSRADLPPVPPLPDLPRVPGRAPPPPR
ncbi:MAG: hypothetical protein HYY38_04325 [Rhodospirillales bacterium]|nr:hypothetical protein [Rhodospirillales bacterium]